MQSSSCLHITFLSHKQKRPDPVVTQSVPLKSLIRSSNIRTKGENKKQNKEVKWTPCTPDDRKGVSESCRELSTPRSDGDRIQHYLNTCSKCFGKKQLYPNCCCRQEGLAGIITSCVNEHRDIPRLARSFFVKTCQWYRKKTVLIMKIISFAAP